MTQNQIALVKQYLKDGLDISFKMGTTTLLGIIKTSYENSTWWAKTVSGDFKLWNLTSNLFYIKVANKYQPLFDGTGKTLVRQGPIDNITAPYYHYMVNSLENVRPGSMVIIDNAEMKVLARVINKGSYMDMVDLVANKTINIKETNVRDLTGFKLGTSYAIPEDLMIDVILIKLKIKYLRINNIDISRIYIITMDKLNELGFIITELI